MVATWRGPACARHGLFAGENRTRTVSPLRWSFGDRSTPAGCSRRRGSRRRHGPTRRRGRAPDPAAVRQIAARCERKRGGQQCRSAPLGGNDRRDRELHPDSYRRSCSRRLGVVVSIKGFDPPFVRTTTPTLEDIASVKGYGAHAPRRSASVAAPGLASARLRLVH